MRYNEKRLNVRRMIRNLGGNTPLHQELIRHGVKISIKSIEAWAFRNSVPSSRLPLLMEIGVKKHKSFSFEKFLEPVVTPLSATKLKNNKNDKRATRKA